MDSSDARHAFRWLIQRILIVALSALSATVFGLVAFASPRIAGTLMHLVGAGNNRQRRQSERYTASTVEICTAPVASAAAITMPGPRHAGNMVTSSGGVNRGSAEPDSLYSSISVPVAAFANPFHNRDRTASLTSVTGSEPDEVLAIGSPKPVKHVSAFPRARKPAPLLIENPTSSPSTFGHGSLLTPVSASDFNLRSAGTVMTSASLSRRSSSQTALSKTPTTPTRGGLPTLPESPLSSPYSSGPPSPVKPYNVPFNQRHSTTTNSPVKSPSSAPNHERCSSCPAVPIPITLPLSDAIQAISSSHYSGPTHAANGARPPSPTRSIVDVAARLLPRFGAIHSTRAPAQPQAQLVQRISIIHPSSSSMSSSSSPLSPPSNTTHHSNTSPESPTQANGGLALAKMLSASRTMRAVTGLARGMQSSSSVGNQRRPPPQMTVHTSVVSAVDGRTLVVSSVNSAGQKTLATPGIKSLQQAPRLAPDPASKV